MNKINLVKALNTYFKIVDGLIYKAHEEEQKELEKQVVKKTVTGIPPTDAELQEKNEIKNSKFI
jgi:hypothetical protein